MKKRCSKDKTDHLLKMIFKKLKHMEAKMSELSDSVKSVSDALDAQAAQISELGTSLTTEIQQIADKIAAGGAPTPEEIASVKALAQRVVDSTAVLKSTSDQIKAIVP